MSLINSMYLRDESGTPYGVKHVNNKPRVSRMDYLYAIAEGNVSDHIGWSKLGFTPTMTTTESDIWSAAGVYVPPTEEMGMEVYSSSTSDAGTAIKSGTCTGGSTTTIVDTAADFTAATAVAVGDCVILNKAGTSPEFGFVTAVTSATELAVAGGFARGVGGAAGRTYDVVDKSASTGAQAVQICYLDADFANGCEIVIPNGTTVVATTKTDIYRVNAWSVVAAGSAGKTVGIVDLRHIDNTPIYSRITAGFTRARNSFYTVAAGKTLYITEFVTGFGYAANQTHYARLYMRATQFANTVGNSFRTPGIFYPQTEVICANNSQLVTLDVPKRILSGVDIKVSGIATVAGTAIVALRGWLE
jgi:hypothetical protein